MCTMEFQTFDEIHMHWSCFASYSFPFLISKDINLNGAGLKLERKIENFNLEMYFTKVDLADF